jgi:hypothetical protein
MFSEEKYFLQAQIQAVTTLVHLIARLPFNFNDLLKVMKPK